MVRPRRAGACCSWAARADSGTWMQQVIARVPQEPARSLVICNSDGMTARVISSASVICGVEAGARSRAATRSGRSLQQIVGAHVQCGREGVQSQRRSADPGRPSRRTCAFVGLGAGECPAAIGSPCRVHDQVQSQSPEVAGVRGAVPVLGESGQVRALGGLPGTAALDRGGVDDPHVVGRDSWSGLTSARISQAMRVGQLAQPLVVAGLRGQVREHRAQVRASEPQPAGLAGEAEQRLHHRQRDQLGVADPGLRCPTRGPIAEHARDGPSTESSTSRTVRSRGCPDRRPRGPPARRLGKQRRSWTPSPVHVTSATPVTPVTPWNRSSSEASPLTAEVRGWLVLVGCGQAGGDGCDGDGERSSRWACGAGCGVPGSDLSQRVCAEPAGRRAGGVVHDPASGLSDPVAGDHGEDRHPVPAVGQGVRRGPTTSRWSGSTRATARSR